MKKKPKPTPAKRGRHKKRESRETHAWEKEHLIPERPPWMSEEAYAELAKMRYTL